LVLSRLAGLAVESRYLELAREMLGPMQEMLARYPLGFGQWLIALDYMLAHSREISIVGHTEAIDTQALLDVCATGYHPHQVVAFGEPEVEPATVPLLEGRGLIDGRATAYVCIDFVCQRLATEPETLEALLRDG
jgi:uncharacterized protein YyaL (SSP411 family)